MSDKKIIETRWTTAANKHLKGKKVRSVRYLTEEEQDDLGWYSRAVVIEFEDGSLIFPSKDDEGNGAGSIFGQDKNGKDFVLPVI